MNTKPHNRYALVSENRSYRRNGTPDSHHRPAVPGVDWFHLFSRFSAVWRRLGRSARILPEDVMLSSFAGSSVIRGKGAGPLRQRSKKECQQDSFRFRARSPDTFAEKLLLAMGEKFGGQADKQVAGNGRFILTP